MGEPSGLFPIQLPETLRLPPLPEHQPSHTPKMYIYLSGGFFPGVILISKAWGDIAREPQVWRVPQIPGEQRIFTSLDEFLREDKLNLAQKVTKIHLAQQVNKGAPTQEKQKIRWNYRKKTTSS